MAHVAALARHARQHLEERPESILAAAQLDAAKQRIPLNRESGVAVLAVTAADFADDATGWW